MCQEFKVIFDDSSTPVTRFVNFVDFVSTWRRFIDILFARGDLNQSFNYYATHTGAESRMSMVPFQKDFSPSGEQLEHRKLAHEL